MRDTKFDIVKALLIVLVVFGHTTRVGCADATITRVIEVIYVFHVAIFFFLSGYFLPRDKVTAKRIFDRLVVPYLATGVVYYCASWAYGGHAQAIGAWLWWAVSNGVGGASWYLCALIWYYLIILVYRKTASRPSLCFFSVLASAVAYKVCFLSATPSATRTTMTV